VNPMPCPPPRARLEPLVEPLSSLRRITQVVPHLEGDAPHLEVRLAEPIFGRALTFVVAPGEPSGLRLVVPNVMRLPIEAAFGGVHLQALVAGASIVGRCVLSDDGRLHYDLASIGSEEASRAALGELVEVLCADLRELLGLLLCAACATLLPVSSAMALAMVAAVDEERGPDGGCGGRRERGPRLAL